MKKMMKKIIAAATTVVMAVTMLSGNVPKASAEVDLNTLGTYEGEWTYISTTNKANYFDKGSMFEVTFRYDVVDTKTTAKDGTVVDVDFNDTLEYQVFDSNWNGWQRTYVGPNGYDKTIAINTPQVGDTYTIQVPFAAIEAKYTGTEDIRGINLQTGEIGDSKITILSHKIVGEVVQEGAEFTAVGSWIQGSGGTMTLNATSKGKASIYTNEWYVDVSQFSVSGFTNPTVDVTVNYKTRPTNNVQAEILVNGKALSENRVIPRKTGSMTYTTELPEGTTSFWACYAGCTVTRIHVYDNTEKEPAEVTGKTGEEINASLDPCWNLGNSLDAVDKSTGIVGETTWLNPVVTQKTFQAVKDAGFNSVRIPISYFDKVDSNGNIDEDYLARIKKVVSMAKNSGLYVIINIHHDGGVGVTGTWLDISKTGSQFEAIKSKFTKMWQQIAYTFKDYDQHLVFASMDEVMISKCYDTAPDPAYQNINALNQAFVNAVRSVGGYSPERCLMLPGYNTDINLTVANYGTANGFQVPIDSAPNKLILTVNFYDPYNFTTNMASGVTTCTAAELRAIGTQFDKIMSVTDLPIFIGEYAAMDKGNDADRADYLARVRAEAVSRGISTAYWDNGGYNRGGSAIFDRQSNEITESGEILLAAIMDN